MEQHAGGCTLYGGFRFSEGHFSSHSNVTGVSLLVQKALGDTIKQVFCFLDSTIALSWILK
jgi:hypothetical protein